MFHSSGRFSVLTGLLDYDSSVVVSEPRLQTSKSPVEFGGILWTLYFAVIKHLNQ